MIRPLFLKEIQSFFSNSIGYLTLSSFLLINSLLLWVFKGYSHVIHNGFANLNSFFNNSSWILGILIPVITMKSFADEHQNGTLEILKTLPIKHSRIVMGKFLAYLSIILMTLIFSLIFVYSVYQLGNPVGNIDLGSTFTSYIGLILLSSCYISIGMFSSILIKNNIGSFILSTVINAFLYFGFSALESLSETENFGWNTFSITHHFESITRGVIDTSDLIYFISISTVFLNLTKLQLDDD